MAQKERIDILLVENRLAESRSAAQRLVMAGQVRVDGQLVHKPSEKVDRRRAVSVDHGPPYVSRGGEKLAGALDGFPIIVDARVCADVGASTGGFTDCLLQRGAARVYAIDVGHGLLHYRLRKHPQVVVMERTNARYLEQLPEPIDLVTIDAAFISLELLLPPAIGWMSDQGQLVALIKPQFEAGPRLVGKGGVVKDPAVHRAVVEKVIGAAARRGLTPRGLMRSPLLGPKGNVEFLLWCDRDTSTPSPEALLALAFPD